MTPPVESRPAVPTLNIKNERVYELARRLADATGASMTSVIESALEEKLERMSRRQQTMCASPN